MRCVVYKTSNNKLLFTFDDGNKEATRCARMNQREEKYCSLMNLKYIRNQEITGRMKK